MDLFIQTKSLVGHRDTNFQHWCWTHSSLSCLSGGLAQNKNKGWIFPGYRHSVWNSFSYLTETVPFQPVTEVTEWNLERTLMKLPEAVRPLQTLRGKGWIAPFGKLKPMLRSRLKRNLVEDFWDETGVPGKKQGISHPGTQSRKIALIVLHSEYCCLFQPKNETWGNLIIGSNIKVDFYLEASRGSYRECPLKPPHAGWI